MSEFVTASVIAKRWKTSEQLVRRYCKDNRIEGAYQDNGVWYMPKDARKPKRKKVVQEPPQQLIPELLKSILEQRDHKRYKGLYDYLQINLAYSNNRMASNRLTRKQVEYIYKKRKIFTVNEEIKVRDIVEIQNAFACFNYVLDNAMTPISQDLLQAIYKMLCFEINEKDWKPIDNSHYRLNTVRLAEGSATTPRKIPSTLDALITEYEKKSALTLEDLLDFHVHFERIHPFEDRNGRLGRLLMFKECLRHGVVPFIIDDKHRTEYLNGIRCWDSDKSILQNLGKAEQERFLAHLELDTVTRRYLEYHGERDKRKKIIFDEIKPKVKKPS